MRNYQKGFTLIELLACLIGIAGLALAGYVIYVAGHFINKFW